MDDNELIEAEIGNWYNDLEGRLFEVVAVDVNEDTIEIQHFDGTVEELDFQDWHALLPEPAEPPEDWSGAMDVSADDAVHDIVGGARSDWEDPLSRIDRL